VASDIQSESWPETSLLDDLENENNRHRRQLGSVIFPQKSSRVYSTRPITRTGWWSECCDIPLARLRMPEAMVFT
jgi:hypothetical protein